MADWEEDFNWWGEGEQPTPEAKKSSPLETVRPFDRPQEATSKDEIVAVDELGRNVYETIGGQRYIIRPATEKESKTTRAKVEDWIGQGAPLPSGEQVLEILKAIPQAAYESTANAVRGTGTVGDVFSLAAPPVGKVAEAFDESLSFPQRVPISIADPDVEYVESAPEFIDLTDLFTPTFSSPEELFDDLVKSAKADLNMPEGSISKESAEAKLKIVNALSKEELFNLTENLPHFESPEFEEYFQKNIKDKAKEIGVNYSYLSEFVNDLKYAFPEKRNPALDSLTETPLAVQAPIGERASETGKERPSDKKAQQLGFNETVYHTAVGNEDFTSFDLNRSTDNAGKSPQDYLGVHVGTPRAAAERNYHVLKNNPGQDLSGFTMELRARTDKPLTGKAFAEIVGKTSKTNQIPRKETPFTESELGDMISAYEDKIFPVDELRPEDSRIKAVEALRKDLAKRGFTHIPYINNVEDPGSISYIMLVDRPKDSPAVLRSVRAEFNPKKITSPDLRFAEGGMVENIDPISGNEVPPGAKPEEVRDDVPIMASEGEYVIPANVVRYIGLDRIEKMVKQAKKGLEELDAEGRIGGEKATMDEDLPFSPEELMAVDEGTVAPSPAPAMMAEGGMVVNNDMDIDPATGLPRWLLAMQNRTTTPAPAPTTTPPTPVEQPNSFLQQKSSDLSQAERDATKLTGLAKPVRDWTLEDYNKYGKFRNSVDSSVMKAATSIVPFGGLISGVAQRATERNVQKNLTEMLQTGRDLQGKPLSTEQLNTLRETFNKVTSEPLRRGTGLSGVASAIATETGLVKPKPASPERTARYNERVQRDGLLNRTIDFLSGESRPTKPTTTRSSESEKPIIAKKSSDNSASVARNRSSSNKTTTSKTGSVSFSRDKTKSSNNNKKK